MDDFLNLLAADPDRYAFTDTIRDVVIGIAITAFVIAGMFWAYGIVG